MYHLASNSKQGKVSKNSPIYVYVPHLVTLENLIKMKLYSIINKKNVVYPQI